LHARRCPAISNVQRQKEKSPMDTRIAAVLALILIILGIIDVVIYGSEHFIFLAKKLVELLDWIAFWR
jgi:glutamate racemase